MADTRNRLLKMGYIPLDKSWIIRMGILDLLNGCDDIFKFLPPRWAGLSDDLVALSRALTSWKADEKDIYVGESATIFRFLKFASWVLGKNKRFILRGTLLKRRVCDDPNIIYRSLSDLLCLDGGTSQWASVAVLLGRNEQVSNPPFKLQLTYEAVEHWERSRKRRKPWQPRYDETIFKQAVAFLELLKYSHTSFVPQQSEDYCFARAFRLLTKEQGKSLWPSLQGHESNRIEEMELMIKQVSKGTMISSKDHRVVQAGCMLQKLEGKNIRVVYPRCVAKGWPRFFHFLRDASMFL